MLMGEFLTAAQHELPVKVVIYNNSCFGLIPLEAEAAGLPSLPRGRRIPQSGFCRVRGRLRRTRIQGREAERAQRTRSAKRWPATDRRSSMRSSPPTRCRTCRTSTSPWLGASRWPRSGKRFSRLPLGDACRRRLRGRCASIKITTSPKANPPPRPQRFRRCARDSIRTVRLPGLPVDAIRTMTSLQRSSGPRNASSLSSDALSTWIRHGLQARSLGGRARKSFETEARRRALHCAPSG